jgi:hypothetical protein
MAVGCEAYRCINCGRVFYYHGKMAEAICAYRRSVNMLKRAGHRLPFMYELLESKAMCCDDVSLYASNELSR